MGGHSPGNFYNVITLKTLIKTILNLKVHNFLRESKPNEIRKSFLIKIKKYKFGLNGFTLKTIWLPLKKKVNAKRRANLLVTQF